MAKDRKGADDRLLAAVRGERRASLPIEAKDPLLTWVRGGRLVYAGLEAPSAEYDCCCAIVTPGGELIGSAVLVMPRAILTAAHNFAFQEAESFKVAFGARAARSDVGLSSIVRHERFRGDSTQRLRGRAPLWDVAVAHLDREVAVMPAMLATAPPSPGAELRLVGYGATALEDEEHFDGVRRVAAVTLGEGDLDLGPEDRDELGACPPHEFSLGNRTPSERVHQPDTRRGDSGGPVLSPDGSVFGVTNREALPDAAGRRRNCGIYASVPAIADWVRGKLEERT